MNRRTFLRGGLTAALAGPWMAATSLAQTPPAGRGGAAGRGAAPAPTPGRAATAAPTSRRLVLDVNSKSLQWLRSADDVAKAATEMVVGGVCLTVQPYPGHIDPARVAQDLPAFVTRLRTHGLRVTELNGPSMKDLSDAAVESMIGAAAQTGLTAYSLGGLAYDLTKPLGPQLDAARLRLDRLVRLNEKHRMRLLYEPLTGAAAIGGVVLDLLPAMKAFDPRYIGFRWDTGNMALHGDDMWETLMRLAGPYIGAVGWRDRRWVQDLGLLGEGGPYRGPYPRVEPLVTQPDGSAIPGAPGAAAAGGRAGGGRAGGGGRGGRAGAAAQASPEEAPAAGGRGGRSGGPANSAGAGSIDANNPLYRSLDGEMPKRPIGGKNVKGGGWSAPNVAMGTGVVHIPHVVAVLHDIGFSGPSELQSEYPGIGGAERGADKITMPRQFVIGMLKRDVITIRKSFEMANVGLSI